LRLERISGVAVVGAGQTRATIQLSFNIPGDAFVMLTPQGSLGGRSLWGRVDGVNDRIIVRLSRSLSADLRVAWLLLEGEPEAPG
jgi:hypothetical protein